MICARLERVATGRRVMIALVLFLLMLVGMNLAASAFYDATGHFGLLDLGGGRDSLHSGGGYTPAEAYRLIAGYGVAGIRRYYAILSVDMLFPPVIGGFCILALAYLRPRLFAGRKALCLLLLVPLLYVGADWSENAAIFTLLSQYPERLPSVARFADFARATKLVTAGLSLLLVTAGGLALALRRR